MARRGPAKKRTVAPDPLYSSRVIAKLINQSMHDGKRTAAAKQIYGALELLQKGQSDPLAVLEQALENIKPKMEVRSRRIGGAAYQVPTPVPATRKESLALRWLIEAARGRSSKEFHTFAEKLAAEVTDAFNNAGGAVKKRENVHRMAEANKAFAHFRW